MRQVGRIARRIGIDVASTSHAAGVRGQSVFYASQFVLLDPAYFGANRIALSYFHGRVSDDPTFAACADRLAREHQRISRVQVSHSAMRDFVLRSGISSDKVFLIPIGVDLGVFTARHAERRRLTRRRLGIPESAIVIGSFQKDGVGWGHGDEPKLIKGPDVLVRLVARLRERVPELIVLLSGPARGYVKHGLSLLGIPFRHVYLERYSEMASLYHALDLYVVTSREEGGPKAVLEAMAAGVPLVTTKVGQAMDLVQHGVNGWMVDVGDEDGLLTFSELALRGRHLVEQVVAAARSTAEANAYERQDPLWRSFFDGFVEWP